MDALTRSAHEQAARLGISYDLLIRGCRAGKYPHRRFGRLIRFTDEDEAQIIRDAAAGVSQGAADGISPRTAARLARVS